MVGVHPGKLSQLAKTALLDPGNEVYVSSVSFWEISLKYALGKLDLMGVEPSDLPETAMKMGYNLLHMTSFEASSFHRLPIASHRDPFDRMLVWQAITQSKTLISRDADVAEYKRCGLRVLW